MEICTVKPEDTQQVRQLWQYCFDDTPSFVDFFFQERYRPENTLAVYQGEQIASCLHLLPYRIMMRGREMECPYIAGVATWPEFRGRGYVGRLLHTALNHQMKAGVPLSILLPFQYDFYRKYGWELCYEQTLYQDLSPYYPMDDSLQGTIKPVDPKMDIPLLSRCYHTFMEGYNGYILRSEADWNRLLQDLTLDNGNAYQWQSGDHTMGYILYTLSGRTLSIRELVYNHPAVRARLLALAHSHRGGQTDHVRLAAPADDLLLQTQADPRGTVGREPFVMGRIVDVLSALSGMQTVSAAELVLEVSDGFLVNNSGCFLLESTSGRLKVTSTSRPPDLTMTIGVLSQILWGYCDPRQALKQGFIKADNLRALDSLGHLFPRVVPFLTEEY